MLSVLFGRKQFREGSRELPWMIPCEMAQLGQGADHARQFPNYGISNGSWLPKRDARSWLPVNRLWMLTNLTVVPSGH